MAHKLKLSHIKNNYSASISEAMDKNASYEDFLKIILSNELSVRETNGVNRRIRIAKYPYLKYLHDLKLDVFPIEIANQIRGLQSLRFLDEGRNVILVGNPGVGKTHTAIGLGLAANMKMKNVLYITIPNLITELKESMTLNQLTNYKKKIYNIRSRHLR